MSFARRYFLIALLGFRCTLFAQPAADDTAPAKEVAPAAAAPAADPAPADVAPAKELPPATIDANDNPPDEPIPVPQKKNRRRGGARPPQLAPMLHHHSNAIFGEHVVVKPDETIEELILIGGTADIQGTVERDVVIIGGSAMISGAVRGQLVLVGGNLDISGEIHEPAHAIVSRVKLADTARLDRGAVLLGGPFEISPKATVLGKRVIIPFGDFVPHIEGLKSWLVKGLLWGRLLPIGVHWAWIVAGFFLGLYFLTLLLFPGAVKAVFLALEARPVTSVLAGFLTLILFAPLIAILAIAVVGIPVIPFLQVALVLSLLFGKAAVMCFLGRSFGRSAGVAVLQTPLAAFVIGATLLVLAYMIPIFGVLAWILATVFGLGGAVVAIARTFKHEGGGAPPAPVLMTPRPAPATGVSAATGIAAAGFAPPVGSIPATTPPMVAPDTMLLPRAGFWKRLLAAFLDLLLLSLVGPLLGKTFIVLVVAYFVAMWSWRGTTIGSTLLRLKVVRTDGGPVTFAVALVRSLSAFFSAVVLFLGFLWVSWDREKQSWHDKIAGTVVVQMPKGFALL
jgi:uncharacterized RDD family membrane protein YckC